MVFFLFPFCQYLGNVGAGVFERRIRRDKWNEREIEQEREIKKFLFKNSPGHDLSAKQMSVFKEDI